MSVISIFSILSNFLYQNLLKFRHFCHFWLLYCQSVSFIIKNPTLQISLMTIKMIYISSEPDLTSYLPLFWLRCGGDIFWPTLFWVIFVVEMLKLNIFFQFNITLRSMKDSDNSEIVIWFDFWHNDNLYFCNVPVIELYDHEAGRLIKLLKSRVQQNITYQKFCFN